MEQTIQCRICSAPYAFYAFYAGDQSACPKCRTEARKADKSWYSGVKSALPIMQSLTPQHV